MTITAQHRPDPAGGWLLAAAALIMAVEPLAWLWVTWTDPAYASQGLWVALAVAGLFAWSVSAPLRSGSAGDGALLPLLLLAVAVRAAGQALGINILAAGTLVLDVYVLGRALGLERRARAVSPFWLAALFALALPVERVAQRLLGHLLQTASAEGACALLSLGPWELACAGVDIRLGAASLMVDLPCAGTGGLVQLGILFAGLAALTRPGAARAAAGLARLLALALAANVLRIAVIAIGAAAGWPLLEEPWHGLIGWLSLAPAAMAIGLWALRTRPLLPAAPRRPARIGVLAGSGAIVLATVAILLPARPLDAHLPATPLAAPASLAGFVGRVVPLSEQERRYFTRHGGEARRLDYGPFGVTLVSTGAPLRHLHDPRECLRGAGHAVRYLGPGTGPLPSSIYESRDPSGQVWRVAVTFVAADGRMATDVSAVVWQWLARPRIGWTLVQRVAPAGLPAGQAEAFDLAIAAALDLIPTPPANKEV